MCKEDFSIFRVSNRGTNVLQTVANQSYSVNIPSELRKINKDMKIEVISGLIAIETDSTFDTYTEIGVISNIPIGYNSEVAAGFNTSNYDLLFNVDTSTFDKSASKRMTFHNSNNFEFRISNIPEKLNFTTVATTNTGILAPITNNNYVSFVLKITYYDRE